MSVLDAVLQTLNCLKLDSSSANDIDSEERECMETAEKNRVFVTLPTIAASLGPKETREKLIPTIADIVTKAINADDDEVLLTIAQKLGSFADLVGGTEHAACLLPILEKIISCVEEVVVAQAACDALVEIIPKLPTDVIEDKCVGMIRRILEEDMYCSSRKVTTKLITVCYPLVSPKPQTDLKCRLFRLAESDDEVPLVRAAAVQQLVELAKLVGPDLKLELCLLLTSLVSDNQRVVRAACVAPLVELGRMITDPNEFNVSVRPCIDKLANEGIRDTRRALAASIADLQQVACAVGGSSRSLHQIFLSLLEDNEVETRRVATSQILSFCLASPEDVRTGILLPQLLEHLTVEREEPVRAELVRCSVGLLQSIGRQDSLPLVQHILGFLNDTSSQSKQYVFEHFSELVTLIPATDVQLTLLPSLLRLWQDKNWRVRLGVVQSVPFLFPNLPETCARETVLPANLAWLRDPSWYVRECACRTLARLLRTFPGLCKDALNGLGQKAAAAAAVAATGGVTLSTASVVSNNTALSVNPANPSAATAATNLNATANQQSVTDATIGSLNPSNSPGNSPMNPVNVITAQAAAGGLKALATDSNYHLRQIYITVVQTIWGPGIPDEAPYSATGDAPGMGICLPGVQNAFAVVGTKPSSNAIPAYCQPSPQVPAGHLSTCASQLLRLAADDVVANVRICAAQALQLISGALDKK
ncbi:serine/threonine-protein phosphatase 2A regulatory subunit A [Paragonimus westermani]|uniref:Serine/threonine-protein phosphatase 2A regulatory subunit A n=1 Tax=Paragonimus westermani TaxID=34504 RepID=A0A5J4NZU7_9TREM|nr:serine/threonine-protein phosphatase 2A regulatory subunit A [Paragonimus westermani]